MVSFTLASGPAVARSVGVWEMGMGNSVTCLGPGRTEYQGFIIESVTGEENNYRIVARPRPVDYDAVFFETHEAAIAWIEDEVWGHRDEFGRPRSYPRVGS